MAAKYNKAPISELVLGVFFKSNILLNNGILFELLGELLSDFPIINTHPVFDEEDLVNDIIQTTLDYSQAGFSVYRLSSEDSKWHIFLQQNAVTLHWSRKDHENVGNYPGFINTFNKFNVIYDLTKKLVQKSNIEFEKHIKSYYLSYNDRVNFEEYKNTGLIISDIINIPAPYFFVGGKKYAANNYYNKYSTPCEDINGHSLMSINTPTVPGLGQFIIVENKLKGIWKENEKKSDLYDWFGVAHEIQLSFFESIFNSQILKSWE